jgi:hypothetical protein
LLGGWLFDELCVGQSSLGCGRFLVLSDRGNDHQPMTMEAAEFACTCKSDYGLKVFLIQWCGVSEEFMALAMRNVKEAEQEVRDRREENTEQVDPLIVEEKGEAKRLLEELRAKRDSEKKARNKNEPI